MFRAAPDFDGREELWEQVKRARAQVIDADGSLKFAAGGGSQASVLYSVPIEAAFEDVDGVMAHALLHVKDGYITELELYKEDGSALSAIPMQHKIEIFTPSNWEN